jgi:hypothetical protein
MKKRKSGFGFFDVADQLSNAWILDRGVPVGIGLAIAL